MNALMSYTHPYVLCDLWHERQIRYFRKALVRKAFGQWVAMLPNGRIITAHSFADMGRKLRARYHDGAWHQ